MNIQELTSNVAITEKNEKQYIRKIIQLCIQGTHRAFSDTVTVEIHIVHSHPPLCWGGIEPPIKFSKRWARQDHNF